VEVEGGLHTGEEGALPGEDTRVAGAEGLQAQEGGLHQEGGAGLEEEGAEAGAPQGGVGQGPGQGLQLAEDATQAPHRTLTPLDRVAATFFEFYGHYIVASCKCSI